MKFRIYERNDGKFDIWFKKKWYSCWNKHYFAYCNSLDNAKKSINDYLAHLRYDREYLNGKKRKSLILDHTDNGKPIP